MDRRQFLKKGGKVAAITAVTPCSATCSDYLGKLTGVYVRPKGISLEHIDKKWLDENAIKIQ